MFAAFHRMRVGEGGGRGGGPQQREAFETGTGIGERGAEAAIEAAV